MEYTELCENCFFFQKGSFKMEYENTIRAIDKHKIITIVRGLTQEQLIRTVEAMERGGIRLAEVTFNASEAGEDETIAGHIHSLCTRFAGRMHIGAGTVLTEHQVRLAADAGAEFIISPDTNPDVIRVTRQLGMVSIPGAFTPSEATTANHTGADFVKLFPNGEVAPTYLNALTVPLSHIRFLAVGGVTPENLMDYIRAGACGVGVAGGIVDKKRIAAGDYTGITELAERYVSVLKNEQEKF